MLYALDRDGWVGAYEDLDEAESALEWIDVSDGEYLLVDDTGAVYEARPSASSRNGFEIRSGRESNPKAAELLRGREDGARLNAAELMLSRPDLRRVPVGRKVLPVHPVPMRTTFDRCILVNFAVEPRALAARLPAHLEPDLHEGRAFVSIVIAHMAAMRPVFLPRALGVTYNQVVYRAVVRCGGERGVTFLRSDADNPLMVAAGNALTFFRFHRARITWDHSSNRSIVRLAPHDLRACAGIEAVFDIPGATFELPATSHFESLSIAQPFLTELYAAFGAQRDDGRVEVVRIERSPWNSRVLPASDGAYEAMTSGSLFTRDEASLDSVFYVQDLEYHWRRLALEPGRRGS